MTKPTKLFPKPSHPRKEEDKKETSRIENLKKR